MAEPEPEEEPAPIPNVIPMTQPRQMPPLIIDHFDAPKPEPQPAPAPEEPLPPLQTPEQPEKLKKADVQLEAAQIAQQITQQEPAKPEYQFPPVDLLKAGSGQAHDGTEEMRQNAERLSDTLQSFGIEAHIINVTRGPSVTRYELELQRGVKLSKVTNLADDIALALGASGVRIAAIPDKISVVGIEVPNRIVSVVMAREVIDSPEFAKHKSKVSFAVGKDIGGNRIIGDIGKLPHLLIAGTTGSGKSVCMNSLIISLLYKAKPEEVKLIMIDPKMVELGIYNGIPHLLIPVVTDPEKGRRQPAVGGHGDDAALPHDGGRGRPRSRILQQAGAHVRRR
ncbi:MAG: DNA translocase FtsK [Oscillospiraceae bacterium]